MIFRLGILAAAEMSSLSGTPKGIPMEADCAIRQLAWEYGKKLLPERGEFKSLFDAMQLAACNLTAPTSMDEYVPPSLPTPRSRHLLFVSASGDDSAAGTSKEAPFRTLAHAVAVAATYEGNETTILVRGGTYYLPAPVQLTAAHSGLTIQNFEGERVRVSGGVAFTIPKSAWSPYKQHVRWDTSTDATNVYGQVAAGGSADGIVFLGNFDNKSSCAAAAENALSGSDPKFTAWSYYNASAGSGFARNCFGRTDGAWAPVPQANASSAVFVRQNVWAASLGEDVVAFDADAGSDPLAEGIPGLRLDGTRAIRAKYPNGDPERSGDFLRGFNLGNGGGDYVKGWIPLAAATEWVPPRRKPNATELVVTAADWPGVEWPMKEKGGSSWTGEGAWGEYHLGLGGYCDDLEPPVGYWCAMRSPRGQNWDYATNKGNGAVQTHMSPDGMVLPRAAAYAHPEDAVVQAWRGGGRWFTQQWRASGFVASNQTLLFDPTTGFQGGEGMTTGGQWWVENVLEECDDAREYYYDRRTKRLYYNPNATTEGPTGREAWVATQQRVLFNISGSMAEPVTDVTIAGLILSDTRYTYFDPHGMPSGGDWALQRSGAITAEGTARLRIARNELVNLDGIGIALNGFHRNASIVHNEMAWIGGSAMTAWGHTSPCLNSDCTRRVPYKVGPDARGGEQPQGTLVQGNLVRELGLYQKQSSMWFQATTHTTRLLGNVHFNGPRAGINFNDGMGGGDEIRGNLLANCVRESGDHGPFNSWDRVPYITTLKTGQPSIVPAWREIHRNFFLSTYASQCAIDNDDGSCYYRTHDNFFPYAGFGLKSDYGGQFNEHYRNIYAFVGSCYWVGVSWLSGNSDLFVNNTCIANSQEGGFGSDCNITGCSWDTTPCIPPLMEISGNAVYNEYGAMPKTKICDPSNHIAGKWPTAPELVAMGRAVLQFPSSL